MKVSLYMAFLLWTTLFILFSFLLFISFLYLLYTSCNAPSSYPIYLYLCSTWGRISPMLHIHVLLPTISRNLYFIIPDLSVLLIHLCNTLFLYYNCFSFLFCYYFPLRTGWKDWRGFGIMMSIGFFECLVIEGRMCEIWFSYKDNLNEWYHPGFIYQDFCRSTL